MPLFYSGQTDYINKLNAASDEAFSTAVAATAGGTTALNLSGGGSQFVTMGTGNTTFTFTNVPSTAYKFTLYVKQDATGSRTVTWPTTSWPAATAPTLTTTGNRIDIIEFRTVNSGSTWYGRVVSQNHV
jgi:hypothetical protein